MQKKRLPRRRRARNVKHSLAALVGCCVITGVGAVTNTAKVETMAQAYNMTTKTGTAIVVGIAAPNENVTINAFSLPNQAKTLTGSWLGQGNPAVDYPKLLDLNAAGKLKLEPLVSETFLLDQVNEGFEQLKSGKNIRGVIRF